MRAIKFRAWHTKQKKMYSAEEMAEDQLTLLTTGYFINVSGASTKESEIDYDHRIIPMQYIGLKDKNGVEIYEEDILKYSFSNGTGWKQIVKWYNSICGFSMSNSEFYEKNREIIGNIYENPEPLKGERE